MRTRKWHRALIQNQRTTHRPAPSVRKPTSNADGQARPSTIRYTNTPPRNGTATVKPIQRSQGPRAEGNCQTSRRSSTCSERTKSDAPHSTANAPYHVSKRKASKRLMHTLDTATKEDDRCHKDRKGHKGFAFIAAHTIRLPKLYDTIVETRRQLQMPCPIPLLSVLAANVGSHMGYLSVAIIEHAMANTVPPGQTSRSARSRRERGRDAIQYVRTLRPSAVRSQQVATLPLGAWRPRDPTTPGSDVGRGARPARPPTPRLAGERPAPRAGRRGRRPLPSARDAKTSDPAICPR